MTKSARQRDKASTQLKDKFCPRPGTSAVLESIILSGRVGDFDMLDARSEQCTVSAFRYRLPREANKLV